MVTVRRASVSSWPRAARLSEPRIMKLLMTPVVCGEIRIETLRLPLAEPRADNSPNRQRDDRAVGDARRLVRRQPPNGGTRDVPELRDLQASTLVQLCWKLTKPVRTASDTMDYRSQDVSFSLSSNAATKSRNHDCNAQADNLYGLSSPFVQCYWTAVYEEFSYNPTVATRTVDQSPSADQSTSYSSTPSKAIPWPGRSGGRISPFSTETGSASSSSNTVE